MLALLAAPAAADAMEPAMAPMAIDVGSPAPVCFGNSVVGIALEGSAGVCGMYMTAIAEVMDFIDDSSGVDSANGANGNLYYVNTFSSFTDASTGNFSTNFERDVSDEVDITLFCDGGSVNAAAGIRDLVSAFNDLGAGRGIAFVILASFPDEGNPIIEAIASLRAQGVVVVAIAVGDGTSMATMMDIADEDASGSDLIFSAPSFAQLADTLTAAFNTVDVDNDGLSECLDGCPTDPIKIAPGECGCGLIEGLPGECFSFDDFAA
eukprot:jgi/Ulvmu1/2496/UM137_0022.1